ncbi:hypothetical protein LTR27_002732 [Elasticomyces elasticus]|nr:hypothetical protein LTR27_002732 [Elasticomyces elasticus]
MEIREKRQCRELTKFKMASKLGGGTEVLLFRTVSILRKSATNQFQRRRRAPTPQHRRPSLHTPQRQSDPSTNDGGDDDDSDQLEQRSTALTIRSSSKFRTPHKPTSTSRPLQRAASIKIQARELVGRDDCPQCKKHWLDIFAGIDLPPGYGGRDQIAGERGLMILELRNIHTDELCLLGPQEKYEPIVTGGNWKDWQIPKKKMPKPEKNGSMYGKPYVAPRYSGSTSEKYVDKVVAQAVKQMKRNMTAAASIPETTASIDSTTPPTAPAPTTNGSAERAVEPMLNAEAQAASPPRVVRSSSAPPPYSASGVYGEAEMAMAGAAAPPPSSPAASDDNEGGDVGDALPAVPSGAGGPAQLDTTPVDVLAASEIAVAKSPTKRKRSSEEFGDDEEARAVMCLKHDGVDASEDETVAAATTADAAAWSLGGLVKSVQTKASSWLWK